MAVRMAGTEDGAERWDDLTTEWCLLSVYA